MLHHKKDNEVERVEDENMLYSEQTFQSEGEAIDAYLRVREGNLDGVKVDFNA